MTEKELRYIARLAWNNWPDSEDAKRSLENQDEKDPWSREAWDRVIAALRKAL